MATLLLQAAGSAIGGVIGGPVGAIIGRAAGALAGSAIDNSLFAKTDRREGPRLDAARVMQADEGGGVARVYGTARVAGQILWGTRFEEESETERQGGKGGGPKTEVTTYSYFGNFAVGLCEGPISGVRRIWADGEEIDRDQYTIRIYCGDETQEPDPLIEAKQGRANAPAYRGLAYLVFERLPLARWGNRIPQISCEVLRPIGELPNAVKAVTIIPGATEHGLDPRPVRERLGEGEDRILNRNVSFGSSDWSASIDEMRKVMPHLERVALVVAWFSDDLRAGHASIKPKVEIDNRREDEDWRVGETGRREADLVSRYRGVPAYGGTPSDHGVIRAMEDLRARGLMVTYYPFILLDVPPGNGLPDPYGGVEQAAFPWRGRMTLDLAETMSGTADRTANARADIARFVGTATASDFRWENDRLRYSGPAEWSYRRMIFHQAHLAKRGGAAAFVIGSEMRGLTRLRDESGRFPFVEALIAIADEVKQLMPAATVTYAADWSEYACYRPADGSGEILFNLDPLWASASIDVVGIDNYLPLSDWRDEGDPGGGFPSPYERAALAANLDAGEWFDWYYANEADRTAGLRTPITDGAAGKPFVYRDKDLKGWWSNRHFDRGAGGVEIGSATAWVPKSKPIWFTELGCPAVDRGGNQPNVFVDPKSSESFIPYHSRGFRDDLAQRRFLEASLAGWKARIGGNEASGNPISPVYGAPMVDPDAIHVWTWDARPYPAFPLRNDLWADGGNWRLGHWLNGRITGAPADALIAEILEDHGIEGFDCSGIDAILDGYVVDGPRSARDDIESILALVGATAFVSDGVLTFRSLARRVDPIPVDRLVDGDGPLVEKKRGEAGEMPDEVAIGHLDPDRAYQPAVASAALGDYRVPRKGITTFPAILNRELAQRYASRMIAESEASNETIGFAVAPNLARIEPGDVLMLPGRDGHWLVTRIETGQERKVEARLLSNIEAAGANFQRAPDSVGDPTGPGFVSRPAVQLLDLPLLPDPGGGGAIAIHARPWTPVAIDAGLDGGLLSRRLIVDRPASMGRLAADLTPGPFGLIDRGNALFVRMSRGAPASIEIGELFAGGNCAAIIDEGGRTEVLQFRSSEEIEAGVFRLSELLRGQAGTEEEASAGFATGTRFVLLNETVRTLSLRDVEIGQRLLVRAAPVGRPLDDPAVTESTATLGLRAQRPFSPVHLKADFHPDGTCRIEWVRRTRIGGDSWQMDEVPLGEDREFYRIRISLPDVGSSEIEREIDVPIYVLGPQEQTEVFGTMPARLRIEVAQLSAVWGAGAAAVGSFPRPAN